MGSEQMTSVGEEDRGSAQRDYLKPRGTFCLTQTKRIHVAQNRVCVSGARTARPLCVRRPKLNRWSSEGHLEKRQHTDEMI